MLAQILRHFVFIRFKIFFFSNSLNEGQRRRKPEPIEISRQSVGFFPSFYGSGELKIKIEGVRVIRLVGLYFHRKESVSLRLIWRNRNSL